MWVLLISFCAFTARAADYSCGSHANYESYPPSPNSCLPYYYQCVNGVEVKQSCGDQLVYNEDLKVCDYTQNVIGCSTLTVTDCKDSNGNSIDGLGYTSAADCSDGYYYKCENGVPVKDQCDPGELFDPGMQKCLASHYTPDCTAKSSVDSVEEDDSAPIIPPTTPAAPDTTADVIVPGTTAGTTPSVPDSGDSDDDIITGGGDKPNTTTTDAATGAATTTIATDDIATTAVTTSTTGLSDQIVGKNYVGFVVDDTGSMSVEISAVTEWIQECVTGTSESCGDAPTGGWLVVSYNDPGSGTVVGPTLDTQTIIDELETYYAHGGGDCPEMAMDGISKLASSVPDENADCKIYIFTDATPKDSYREGAVTALLQSKGCRLVPILTGCCGECPPACESVSPEYCVDHVTDTTTSTRSRKSSYYTDSASTIFYVMSEETGGNIYVSDKPSSPDEMLDFLEEEITLGFCPTSTIAGPSPFGYECEADCQAMGMCWDKSASKCYCNNTCVDTPIPHGYSYCDGAQHVECDAAVAEEIVPDLSECQSYFQCNYGELYHVTCANGTIYSDASTSHCDYSENVAPPCGTYSVVISP